MATQTVGPIVVKINGDSVDLSKKLEQSTSGLRRFATQADVIGKKMSSLGRSLTMRVTAPILAIGAAGVASFATFEKDMRNVNTIAKQSEDQFKKTSKAVLDLAMNLGQSPTGLAEALYDINSASFQGAEGLKVLEAATKAGKAGLASTRDAGKAIVSVLNAYGMSADNATDVSDILFKTVEKGVTTFGELSQFLGTAVATASIAKIPFEQVAAGVATMTRGGIKTDEAFTALNRFMMKLIDGGPELQNVFQRLGYTSAATAAAQLGLGDTMKVLQEATGGSAEEIVKLGFEMRSFKAVAALARNEGKEFAKDLVDIGTKAGRLGATQSALNEQNKSLYMSWMKLKSTAQVVAIEIGASLAPMMLSLVDKLKGLLNWWKSLDNATKEMVIRWALIAASIGPVLLVVGKLTIAIGAISKALALTGPAFAAFANPVGLVVLAISAVTAAVIYATKVFIDWRMAVADLAKSQEQLAKQDAMIAKEFGGIDKLRAANQARYKQDIKARASFNVVLRDEMDLEKKILELQQVASREGISKSLVMDFQQQIQALKAQADAVSQSLTPKKFFQTAEDKEAQADYQKALEKTVVDQLRNEAKINYLIEKRKQLQDQIAKTQEGSKAFFELRQKALDTETELKTTLESQVQEVKDKAKEQGKAPQFAAAVEVGTVEAYRARIGAEKQNQVEKNTQQMKDKLTDLVKIGRDNLSLLGDALKTAGQKAEVVSIL